MMWNVREGGRDFGKGNKRCLFAGVGQQGQQEAVLKTTANEVLFM